MTQHLPAITVRPLPSSDYPAVLQMRVDAFSAEGVVPWPQEGQPHYIPADRRLGAYDQDRLVGHAGAWDFGQWLGGRRVPMAGIGSVIVVPEARGRGVGGALVNAVLSQAAEQGDVISCLYPTAPGVYRRFG
ncbi:MAG: GNAT family N-acetyltransferase, partial [Euzebya sp.]